jgi:hypothetical protein
MPLINFSKKINSPRARSDAGPTWRLAAPSAVWPEALPGNCKKLAALPGRPVAEVGLCLFETRSCLEYGRDDLPAWLAELGLSFHVHLPLDLPWQASMQEVSTAMRGLINKVRYLSPRCFVLHPPGPDLLPEMAALFREMDIDPARVLLENVDGQDLTELAPVIASAGFSVCLDLGHMLAFGQRHILDDPRLTGRVAMIHAYAPGPRGEHKSLALLDAEGLAALAQCLTLLPADGTLMVECFRPADLLSSLQALGEILPGLLDASPAGSREATP